MSDGKKVRPQFSHADCEHDATRAARAMCRRAQIHADCDHGTSNNERGWCTRLRNAREEL